MMPRSAGHWWSLVLLFGGRNPKDPLGRFGPWIVTDLETDAASITCHVNGEVRQDGSTGDMVFDIAELVSWMSSVMTLLPGDVILTGTPAGVGPIRAGDEVSVTIAGVGTLTNPVIDRG